MLRPPAGSAGGESVRSPGRLAGRASKGTELPCPLGMSIGVLIPGGTAAALPRQDRNSTPTYLEYGREIEFPHCNTRTRAYAFCGRFCRISQRLDGDLAGMGTLAEHSTAPGASTLPITQPRQLYIVECGAERVAVSTQDAGRALDVAGALLGRAAAGRRDAIAVREPELEEVAAFEARRSLGSGPLALAAIRL